MAFIPAANCVKTAFRTMCYNQIMVNTLWTKWPEPATEELLEVFNGLAAAWYNAQMTQFLLPEVTFVDVTSQAFDSESAPSATLVENQAGTSTSGGHTAPLNAALCIKLATSARGRSYRGRWYQPAIPEAVLSATDKNQVTGTFLTNLLAAMGELADAFDGLSTGIDHVVVSFRHNNAPRAAGVATLVNAYVGNVFLDSQRRRLTGRGT